MVSKLVDRSKNEDPPDPGVSVLVGVLPTKRAVWDYQKYCFGDKCNLKNKLDSKDIREMHSPIYLYFRERELLHGCDTTIRKGALSRLFEHLKYDCPYRQGLMISLKQVHIKRVLAFCREEALILAGFPSLRMRFVRLG